MCECACGLLRVCGRLGCVLRVRCRVILVVGIRDIVLTVSSGHIFVGGCRVVHCLYVGDFHSRRRIDIVCGLRNDVLPVRIGVDLQRHGCAELPVLSRRSVLIGL